jgi:hypothetical protein
MSGIVVLRTTVLLASAAPVATARSSPTTIDFAVATASRDEHKARTAGAFTMIGRFADVGTVVIALRFGGPRVDGTATLIGTRGIFTIGLRGTFGAIVDDGQGVAGAWSVCGGTGAYTRLRGRGHWNAVADFGAAPAGMMPPTLHGAFLGRTHRGSMRTHAWGSPVPHAPC